MVSFKPYYKWITFNIKHMMLLYQKKRRFKPYYKWITFNMHFGNVVELQQIQRFKPYYKWITFNMETSYSEIGTIYTAEF